MERFKPELRIPHRASRLPNLPLVQLAEGSITGSIVVLTTSLPYKLLEGSDEIRFRLKFQP